MWVWAVRTEVLERRVARQAGLVVMVAAAGIVEETAAVGIVVEATGEAGKVAGSLAEMAGMVEWDRPRGSPHQDRPLFGENPRMIGVTATAQR